MARWWSRKYRLPSNHELFQDRTLFDHLVEYYVDKFEERPIESYRNKDGEIQFTDTGDELIDLWEQQIAEGHDPNLYEAFSEESLEQIRKRTAAKQLDPYQGLSMKETFDKIEEHAKRQGLTVGGRYRPAAGTTPEDLKNRIRAELEKFEDE